MALDALLAKLEGRAVTSVPATRAHGVTPETAAVQACTSVTSVTAQTDFRSNHASRRGAANNESLPDPRAQARRRHVLAILANNPSIQYAMTADTNADPENVILALAIRNCATCELLIPRAKFGGLRLIELLDIHSATIH